MPTIQSADLWRESKRYDAYGPEMLRFNDRHEREMLYGPTNEELITQIFRDGVRSYRDLPRNLYHIQWKFRDEVRPRFGVMRGREFLMKDAYSFDISAEAARRSYNKMFVAYLRTFARMGLKSIPMAADTGPIGGDLSHEFIILAETGESRVYCHADLLGDARTAGRRRFRSGPRPPHPAVDAPLRRDRREARRRPLRGRGAGGQARFRPRHRGRPHFLLRHQVFRAHGGPRAGTGREHDRRADGLLRRRRVAAGRRHHRGEPRPGRHRLAGAGCPLRGRPRQSQGRRQGHRPGLRRSLRQARAGRRLGALRRHARSAPGPSSRPWT